MTRPTHPPDPTHPTGPGHPHGDSRLIEAARTTGDGRVTARAGGVRLVSVA
ncbi:hypothetical protein FB565_009058 [Actinoplanes lutulentus]|uniref:Uncharacterized protein n=1 Tax=Actinoplanes lutulentus TaxID=1287878 RepID=A0A327Z9E1_9ACTN|nr:hypothetical protein [Actinoplanes lutulentus]RAK34596.1 hypothetical protein B0I29_111198 [Actinoplanes lutulentus]